MDATTDPAGPTGPTVPAVERPSTLRVFAVVAVVRVVVVAVVQVASVVTAPAAAAAFRNRLDERLGRVRPVDPAVTDLAGTLGAAVGGVIALGYLVGWAVFARSAHRGVRWGRLGTVVVSGLNLISVVTLPLLRLVGFDLPGWLLGLAGLAVVVDAVVLVLLLLPASRAWFAAVHPARVGPPPGPGPAWPPPPTPWPAAPPAWSPGPPPGATPVDAGDPWAQTEPAPHLDRPPPGWTPRGDLPPGRRH